MIAAKTAGKEDEVEMLLRRDKQVSVERMLAMYLRENVGEGTMESYRLSYLCFEKTVSKAKNTFGINCGCSVSETR